jgi:hypothetical protein
MALDCGVLDALRRYQGFFKRVLEVILLFAIARVIAGIAVVALFSRDSVAWGWELTFITIGVFAVCLLAALMVRRFTTESALKP